MKTQKIEHQSDDNWYEDYTNGELLTNPSSLRNKTMYNNIFVKKSIFEH